MQQIKLQDLSIPEDSSDSWVGRITAREKSWEHARRKRRLAQRQIALKRIKDKSEEHNEYKANIKTGEYSDSISIIEESNDIKQDIKNSSDEISTIRAANEESSDKKCVPLLTSKLLIEIETSECESTVVQDVFRIWMIFENGNGGLDALQSLRQYLINKLDVREILINQSKSVKKRKEKEKF